LTGEAGAMNATMSGGTCVTEGPFGLFPNCDNIGGSLFLNFVYG
jgi:hypothetical protein